MTFAVVRFPDAEALLQREDEARKRGTGLTGDDLIGSWRLDMVWSKGSRTASGVSGSMLRALGARLEIAAAGTPTDLILANSVRVGPLQLRFEGVGRLQGRRPLLRFDFERLLLLWGGHRLIDRSLPIPPPQKQAFFALIGSERQGGSPAAAGVPPDGAPSGSANPDTATAQGGGWLAARGRGGGLALWSLQ